MAGTPMMQMFRYMEAFSSMMASAVMWLKASFWMIPFKRMIKILADRETRMERRSMLANSSLFFSPYACAVSPLVPMRRKPKFQYSRFKIVEPTDMADV